MQKFLEEADAEFQSYGFDCDMETENGVVIDKDYVNGFSSYFDEKILVISIFTTPNTPARVLSHSVWKDGEVLQLEIECEYGEMTAVTFVMMVLEFDEKDVENIKEVCLNLSYADDK